MSSQDQVEFSSLLQEWATAIVANDPEAIGRFADDEWALVGEGGIFPGEEFLSSVASGDITHDTMSFEVHDVRIHGDVAVVIARGRNSGSYKGESFQLDEWVSDVFVRRNDQWKCTLTHLTPVRDQERRSGPARGENPHD